MKPPTVSCRPGDYATHRAQLLAHCLWMHEIVPEYARTAASGYERNSAGALTGLSAEFKAAVAAQPKEKT